VLSRYKVCPTIDICIVKAMFFLVFSPDEVCQHSKEALGVQASIILYE
jgi:hypothetical protein